MVHIHVYYNYWGEPERAPHWSWQKSPACGIMVCIYVSMYLSIYLAIYVSFTLRFSHPGSQRICVRPEMFHVFWYMDDLCSHVWFKTACTQLNSKNNWSFSCLRWRLSMKTGRWKRRHMVEMDSAYWDSGAVAVQQLANALVWIKNDWWAYCTAVLWRSYRQRRNTELTTLPACYLWM